MGKKNKGSESLFADLASLDEVTAWSPTGKDHDAGIVPPWCEMVLEVARESEWPIKVQWPLRRHDGEMIIDVIHQTLHTRPGGNVTDMLWTELDRVVVKIQKRVEKGREPKSGHVGEARGLALAIAILTNPYAYDLDEVRAEAMARYERN